MIIKHKKLNNSGFVMLFAVVLSSMILAITLGALNISYKELVFTTTGKSSGDAFYAADTGIECALYWDKRGAFGSTPDALNPINTECAQVFIDVDNVSPPIPPPNPETGPWNFQLFDTLTGQNKSCADVTVTKDPGANPPTTTIISNGYNIGDGSVCTSANINGVERQIRVDYED